MSNRQKGDVSRPAILYVEQVDTKPDIDAYLETRRLSVIDIEIDMIQAQEIARHIEARSKAGMGGAIRVRFTGRLIHL